MKWALYVIAAFLAVGAFLTITSVGKPREPTRPTIAALTATITAAEIVVLVISAGRLS